MNNLDNELPFFCPVCENFVESFLPFGLTLRKNAECPICKSLERHRLAWIFFKRQTNLFAGRKKFLHIAPEDGIAGRLKTIPNISYISADINSAQAMIKIDLTNMEFEDNSFEVIYCSHVLEHVADDYRAILEIKRVLSPGGWVVIQVPIYHEKTFEDFTITDPKVRERLFGKSDHVRRYGLDFKEKLEFSGLKAKHYISTDIATIEEVYKFGLEWHPPHSHNEDGLFFCTNS